MADRQVRALTTEETEMIQGVVDRMRRAREAEGMSREALAVGLRVDFSTIGRWERGEVKDGPPLWAIAGYAKLTGVPVATLLGEDVPREALDHAVHRMLLERLARIDREFDDLHARLGEFGIGEGNS